MESDNTLDTYKLEDGSIIHAVVSMLHVNPSTPSPEPKPADETRPDIAYPAFDDTFP